MKRASDCQYYRKYENATRGVCYAQKNAPECYGPEKCDLFKGVMPVKIIVVYRDKTRRVFEEITTYNYNHYVLHIYYQGFIHEEIKMSEVSTIAITME